MALRDSWVNKIDGEDFILASDINSIATAVMALEDIAEELTNEVDDIEDRVTSLETNVCLKQGTQILMADGTTQSIEFVKYGDMLKSWDLENNEYVDVKAYGVIKTGVANAWQEHIFENGSVLQIFKNHTIYNATQQRMLGSSEWKVGEKGVALDGVETELAWVQTKRDVLFTPRYILLTENSLYFANGILSGHHPKDKAKCYSLGIMSDKVTEQEAKEFMEVVSIYEQNNKTANVEYIKEVAPVLNKIGRIHSENNKHKQALSDRDYKTVKRQQGKLPDDEWDANVEECEVLRGKINENEQKAKKHHKELKEIKHKYGFDKKKSGAEIFREAYDIEMARIRGRKG